MFNSHWSWFTNCWRLHKDSADFKYCLCLLLNSTFPKNHIKSFLIGSCKPSGSRDVKSYLWEMSILIQSIGFYLLVLWSLDFIYVIILPYCLSFLDRIGNSKRKQKHLFYFLSLSLSLHCSTPFEGRVIRPVHINEYHNHMVRAYHVELSIQSAYWVGKISRSYLCRYGCKIHI